MSSKIKIILNGEDFFLETQTSIADLVIVLNCDPKKIAIEKNLEIIARENFADNFLQENDRIEIVHFIGGG